MLGAEVTGFSLGPSTQPSFFEVAGVARDIRSIIGDVRDPASVRRALGESRPDIVIHMAAQALVRRSYADPVETYSTNVMGLVHLLEGVRSVPGVRSVVVVTSDKCYENKEWSWGYRENDTLGGYDPYSSSKGCAELVVSAYRNSYFNPSKYQEHGVAIASARAGNVIGGGDWAEDRLIPDFVRAITLGHPVRIRNPHATRPWQHVLEPLSGYLLLAEQLWENGPQHSEAWNFGPDDDDAKPVAWIAERLTSMWGDGATWASDIGDYPHEAHFLKLDCSRAKVRLGWHPRWRLEDALQQVVAWYKALGRQDDMRVVSLEQIKAFIT